MVNAQTWLDQSYPKAERLKVGEIYLNKPDLVGELDLADFSWWLEKIYISHAVDVDKLVIKNNDEHVEIIKLIKAQQWLDQNYPLDSVCQRETRDKRSKLDWVGGWNNKGKTRAEIIRLDISKQNLEGELDLRGFGQLEELDCSYNKLTNLDLSNGPKLTKLYCGVNVLTELDLNSCLNLEAINCSWNNLNDAEFLQALPHPEKLGELDISHNKFPPFQLTFLTLLVNLKRLDLSYNNFTSDLPPLTQLTKLERLDISNNPFTGSLKPLQNCIKLNYLDISDTNLNSGVEYSPNSVENFFCSADSPVLTIFDLLTAEQKITEIDEYGLVVDFPKKLQLVKQEIKKWNSLVPQLPREIKPSAEIITQELINLTESQKRKIFAAYLLHFGSERELLTELITTSLEFTKAKKQKLPFITLSKQFKGIYNQLVEKLGEEAMGKVKEVLGHCEKLITWELDLENKLNPRTLLIEEKKQVIEELPAENIELQELPTQIQVLPK